MKRDIYPAELHQSDHIVRPLAQPRLKQIASTRNLTLRAERVAGQHVNGCASRESRAVFAWISNVSFAEFQSSREVALDHFEVYNRRSRCDDAELCRSAAHGVACESALGLFDVAGSIERGENCSLQSHKATWSNSESTQAAAFRFVPHAEAAIGCSYITY